MGRDLQLDPVGLLGSDEHPGSALDHLDRVGTSGQGWAPSTPEVVDDLALGQDPQDVGLEVSDEDRGPRLRPGLAPLPFQGRCRLPTLEAQHPGLVAALSPGDDIAASTELLERRDADGLLAEGPVVAGLCRLEQVPGHLPQPILRHPPADVIDGQHRMPALPAQHKTDPLAGAAALDVLVRGVGHELVQGVLRVLVRLPRDQHRLGQVPDPQSHPFRRHPSEPTTVSGAGQRTSRRALRLPALRGEARTDHTLRRSIPDGARRRRTALDSPRQTSHRRPLVLPDAARCRRVPWSDVVCVWSVGSSLPPVDNENLV